MFKLCEYKDLFGEPKTGIHKYRIFDYAILDILVTIFLMLLISYTFKLSIIYSTIITIGLMIITHRLFCVRTKTDILLFSQ
jgi:hypothetical protein